MPVRNLDPHDTDVGVDQPQPLRPPPAPTRSDHDDRARRASVCFADVIGAHMTPDEFREYGHQVIDWIADYQERIESFPVLSQVAPGDIRRGPAGRSRPRPGEPFDGRAARPRRHPAAGHHALAAPVVLRLLPGQHERAGDARRPAGVRPRRAGHAVGDLARRHRARDARPRLAGRAARTAGALPLERCRRRRHPAHRVRRRARRAARRPAPRQRRTHRTRRVSRPDGSPSTRRARRTRRSRRRAGSPASAPTRCARSTPIPPPSRPVRSTCAELLAADVAAGRTPALVVASVGATGTGAVDPVRELAALAHEHGAWLHVDARLGRRGRGRSGVALAQRRLRGRRLVLHQPAQVAADQLRLRRVLGGRPRGAGRRAVDPARVPAQRRDRVRRGDRLPRLARAARAALPRAQAVGGDPLVRRGGAARAHPHPRRAGAGVRRLGRGRRAVRARRAASAVARDVPAACRRRRDTRADGARQRVGTDVPHAHRS